EGNLSPSLDAGSGSLRRNAKCAFDYLHEISLFAQDEALRLGHREILTRFAVLAEAGPVGFVRRQTLKSDQPPGHIVRPFMRKKIADQMAAAARNDAAPVFRILLKCIALKRVNLVTNETGNHW